MLHMIPFNIYAADDIVYMSPILLLIYIVRSRFFKLVEIYQQLIYKLTCLYFKYTIVSCVRFPIYFVGWKYINVSNMILMGKVPPSVARRRNIIPFSTLYKAIRITYRNNLFLFEFHDYKPLE